MTQNGKTFVFVYLTNESSLILNLRLIINKLSSNIIILCEETTERETL